MLTSDDEGCMSSQAPLMDLRNQAELRRIYHKIDRVILPLMFMCYFLEFLDKILIGYANVMGLERDLDLAPGQFQWLATILYVGMAVGQLPQAALLQRLPVSKVLGANVALWGAMVCGMAGARGFAGLAALRALLGALEAVVAPALIMVTTQWYTKRQAVPRMGLWYSGIGVGQIVGGLVSWAAQHAPAHASSSSWRIMFGAAGALNVITGVAVFVFLPTGVEAARFLSERERRTVREALLADQAGNGKKVFRWSGVREALTDLQVLLFVLFTLATVTPGGFITSFSAVVIRGLGFTPRQAALLNMPSGAVTIIGTAASTLAILHDFPRWLGIVLLLIPSMLGAGLMSFATSSRAAALTGVYLVNLDIAPLVLVFSMVGANVQGYTKKVVVTGLVSLANACASIVGPQTFRPGDAPGYVPAKVTVFCVTGVGIVLAVLLRVLYGRRNGRNAAARRAAMEAIARGEAEAAEVLNEEETDLKNDKFVYMY
ncbi:Major facilitator superfamily domain, general substrate transporter [Cordyceps fumosorosea ARSEF 2679]|uniref:Major facilitator superfamily domain, general substrate transporter n=1 Tax=Cordyceps fumosorosea (strain ARSEF 2679) TaxID=1081104 RepID=A0A167QL12_CORFA|nr:Major facilitator superfamily domain, general substrate transporter [Cordyceps fumosorosea ARSEF 2679]OAA57735.1 Major facilitator superfamily domain, general substrate transporter [Cordyceps fumosorosea ARSEF 2679]